MVLITLYGDPEIMGRIKTDSRRGQTVMFDPSRPLDQPGAAGVMKKLLKWEEMAGGLEGLADMWVCNAQQGEAQKLHKANPKGPVSQLRGQALYLARPEKPRPPPPPVVEKPKVPSSKKAKPPAPAPSAPVQQPPPAVHVPAPAPAPARVIKTAPPLVVACPVPVVDWDNFVNYWESQADEEMKTL
eukprot:TRINITY_DN1833_c1_g2_i1.p1 TRINITY_DN1833_c1_g2~~TRINITY_DN1833_c1_g2_i1.p1  ORF type:complete len:211 (+),score=49.08 TRINITY_DN1833_c1_g2_i1:76-633(+)